MQLFIYLVGAGASYKSVARPLGVQLVFFFCSRVSKLFGARGSPSSICESSFFIYHGGYHDLFGCP